MGDTNIEWATKVWNFVRGCRRVSEGCGSPRGGGCYAEAIAARFSGTFTRDGKTIRLPYYGLARKTASGEARWTGKGLFLPEKLVEPFHWRAPTDGSRHRVFVNSMSDLFFEEFTNEQIAAGFGVMAACPQHDFLVLTKRPNRMLDWFEWAARGPDGRPEYAAQIRCSHAAVAAGLSPNMVGYDTVNGTSRWPWPLPNVWIGISAENQATADERIPQLLRTPAVVRWVSAEPLLGPISFVPWLQPGDWPWLSWIVVGGESGINARRFNTGWARSILEQGKASAIPVFMKQMGANVETAGPVSLTKLRSKKGGDPAEWPESLRVREFPR